MEIADLALEEEPSDKREYWISQIAVQKRHSSFFYASFKTISHNQIIAFPKFGYIRQQIPEIVTIIRIAHNNIDTLCIFYATAQGTAVSFFGNVYNNGVEVFGYFL